MRKEDLDLFREIAEALVAAEDKQPVVPPIPTDELFSRLSLDLPDQATPEATYRQVVQDLVLATPRTASREFFNQLFGGRQSKAVLGDLLAVLLNNSMYTYKVAGPMVGVEKAILKKVARMIGYPTQSDGTLAAGGSMTNFMAMLMARDRKMPEIRYQGVQQKMLLYTSVDSHYSIPKNAAFMGVGRDQIRYIESDEYGRMIPARLAEQVAADRAAGELPFFVNATAGTTVMGAFDPIGPLADICEQYKMWLHVDGAYCGGVIYSERFKRLVEGLERTDSFSFNAHKMLGTPLSCSLILVKDKKHLYDSFSNEANYLYQTDGDDFNLGKTSLQCGRRNDALKLWTLWKAVGTEGLEAMVDHQFDLAQVAIDYLQANPDYTLYSHPDSISVCFNYKGVPAEQLCQGLYEEAQLMVGYGSFRGNTFVRLVTINAGNEPADILHFFQQLEQYAEKRLVPA